MLRSLLLLAAAGLLAGCGADDGPERATVTGKVSYKGQPVTTGMITFVSNDPKRPNASSPIQSDGSYDLSTPEFGRGAVVGDYQVTISGRDPNAFDAVDTPGAPMKIQSSTPLKYEDPAKSGLTFKVESGSNTKDFDLTD